MDKLYGLFRKKLAGNQLGSGYFEQGKPLFLDAH
jgi:hypothetical protein